MPCTKEHFERVPFLVENIIVKIVRVQILTAMIHFGGRFVFVQIFVHVGVSGTSAVKFFRDG